MDMPTTNAQTELAPEVPKEAPTDRAPASTRVPAIIVGAVIAAVAVLSIWYLVRGEPLLVQGEVDATRLDIAPRVDGRVADIPVVRGQNGPGRPAGARDQGDRQAVAVVQRAGRSAERPHGAGDGRHGKAGRT
jgi:hypothetical protein